MKKLLFITNGHGEDIIAAEIIRNIKSRSIKIDVIPVVGRGNVLSKLKVNIIGPRKALPGGGFGLRNFSFLIKDLFSGLISKVFSQIRTLRRNKGRYDLVVGVGDIVPIIYSIFTECKFIFVGANKSEYYKKFAFNYTGFEKHLLKRYCALTLARDEKTAENLGFAGVKALFVGNPMMDMVRSVARGQGSGVRKTKTIGFLPGTRDDAYKNIEDLYRVAEKINKLDKNIAFIMSIPSTLDKERVAKLNRSVNIEQTDDFNKVLGSSNLIIGLAGTGNEQSAGLGIPVIAFPGRGAQYNYKFAKAQKELLGDSLLLMNRNSDNIASEALNILYDKKRASAMSKEGKLRMGKPGASNKIAKMIVKMIS
jgi:hypothetical protein